MSAYQDTRVLLLGATGFIGRWVARQLHLAGAELHMLVRHPERAHELGRTVGFGGHVVECDLSDLDQTTHNIREIQPDVLFNLAGYGVGRAEVDPGIAERINSELVAAIAHAMQQVASRGWRGQHVVNVGSALEYGVNSGDLAEGSKEMPRTLYGTTKLRGTRALATVCQERDMAGVTVRLFTVYGPGERPDRLLPTLVRAASADYAIPLTDGTQRRDFCYVEEAAEGLLRLGAASAPRGAIVNLVSGELRTVRQFAETAADVLCIKPSRLRFGVLPMREEEMRHAPVSNTFLRALTGWSPSIDIADGISRTFAYSAHSAPA